ncbi:glycosyltransferase family 2 protein [Christiangramia sediminis]|uniref:Glycosyltransferase family 2 protein n=1 Tax=Christiangramia sediminis TaxID=2881336 RepID=A0A9X1LJ51_9FLAO|nr:glycosyltransferase family A protein [Christiangramia sediminis]MCB7481328.1 glycosyltransferase family 2 protein [Christiangramia sediminis]
MRKNSTSKHAPLVSICIPTYNGDKYLKEALESVQKQSYENLEVIFSDDNSKDQTMKIILEFKKRFHSPVYIYHHTPKGIGSNWNNCVKRANGKYIKFLFQDDILLPECVEKLVLLAEKDKQVGLVFCRRNFLFEQEKSKFNAWLKYHKELHVHWKSIIFRDNDIISGKKLLRDNHILSFPQNKIGEPSAVLIRTECFNRLGYFEESLQQALDVEYWLRIMKRYKVGFLEDQLISFRIHQDQATQLNQSKGINEKELLEKLCYKRVFWHLNSSVRWKLFKSINRNHPIRRISYLYNKKK